MSDATSPRLFDPGPDTPAEAATGKVSAGRRRTIRIAADIAAGRHPANGFPINTDARCGTCAHLRRYTHHDRTYLKCPHHRYGLSHSEASDMRASWPACPLWTAR